MWILEMAYTPTNPPLIQTVIEIKTPRVVEPEPEEPIYTIEDKIAMNYYGCDETIEWIRADNAQCLAKPVRRVITPPNTQNTPRGAVNGSNSYAAGHCTWFTKNQLSWVQNGWGNASRWAVNARNQGFNVSKTPTVGAVAQTARAAGGLGHVGVVMQVEGNTITVQDMNWSGLYVITTRTTSLADWDWFITP